MTSRQTASEKCGIHYASLERASKKIAELLVESGAIFPEVDRVLENAKSYLAIRYYKENSQDNHE